MTQSPVEKLARQERRRREIVVKSELIPPLPDVVMRLLSLLKKGDTEPKDLEEHLHCDPVLVAKMLAIVNSPFYGVQNRIRTIRDAVMVLGFRGLRSLLLASGTAKYLQRDYSCYGHVDKGLWQHSLAVASCARALATEMRRELDFREEMFVAGLLHDIGKMLLEPYMIETNARIASTLDTTLAESQSIGLDHAEAGALVGAKWNLSPLVQATLRHHHGAPVGATAEAIALVRLADAVAHETGIGYRPGVGRAPASLETELHALGISDARWQELREKLRETAQSSAQLHDLSS
jgi:putative nucleotidyltransferase with HDIG domain